LRFARLADPPSDRREGALGANQLRAIRAIRVGIGQLERSRASIFQKFFSAAIPARPRALVKELQRDVRASQELDASSSHSW